MWSGYMTLEEAAFSLCLVCSSTACLCNTYVYYIYLFIAIMKRVAFMVKMINIDAVLADDATV